MRLIVATNAIDFDTKAQKASKNCHFAVFGERDGGEGA
jgi:hypothetical protein